MPPFLLYSKIEFVIDPKDADSDVIPLGFFAEWHDGHFWRISLCSIERVPFEAFENLDAMSKEQLAEPFSMLYQTANRYLKSKGWYQRDYILEDFLTKCFPSYLSFQAPNLFQQAMGEEEDPEEVFEDLAGTLPGRPRRAIWYRLDAPQLVPTAENDGVVDY